MKTRWLTPRDGRFLAALLAACLRATALADDIDAPAGTARERLMEQPRIAGTVGAVASRSPAAVGQVNAFVPPALPGEEVPPAVARPSAVPATAGHSPRADAAARLPADHPPAASPPYHAAGMPVPPASSSEPASRSPPPTSTPSPPLRSGTPPAVAHPSAPVTSAQRDTSRESRDGAPHADRASRERAVR